MNGDPERSEIVGVGNVGLNATTQAALDSSVGFANAPQSAALGKATSNVNVASVAAGWAYQGSRAAYSGGQILNAQANTFNCVSSENGQTRLAESGMVA